MRAGIFTNRSRDEGLKITKELAARLVSAGIGCLLHASCALDGYGTFDERSAGRPDVMITVGGDGTILRIVGYCAEYGIPILGLNMGNVGFLTELEPSDIARIPDILRNKEYTVDERSLLKVSFGRKTVYGLNEAVVMRKRLGRMLELTAEIGGRTVDRYRCDGYIIGAPTGSTAYSLSAGGPVIAPDTGAFALTPVNPHSLHSRPLVVSDRETIVLHIEDGGAAVIVDGRDEGEAHGTVRVERADRAAGFIWLKESNFYSKLLLKLNKWSVT